MTAPGSPPPGGPDFFSVVLTQRAHREFAPTPVDDATVETVLRAATHAPSAENRQPWEFVVVRDPALQTAIHDLTEAAWAASGRAFSETRLTPELVTELVLSQPNPSLVRQLEGRCRKFQDTQAGLALGLLPCRADRLVVYAQFATDRHACPVPGEFQRFLRRHFVGWNPLLEELLATLQPEGAHLWHTTDLDPLPQLHRGNVVLLGDSAHPLLPFTSQGSAAALEDALALAAALWSTDGRDPQALRCALLYPLDDTNPEHLMANRRFFEAQMDRFLRPEARLPQIQTQDYR